MKSNKIIEIIKEYDPSKVVFWVGAGVDSNQPTSLPRAQELLTELLNLSCGEIVAKRILDDYTSVHGGIPRLETVVSELKTFESELKNNSSLLNGFKSFLECPYNECHNVIAQYVELGANVVTTNYGNAIPNAVNDRVGMSSDHLELEFDDDLGIYCYKSANLKIGSVFHIHGIADDLNTLGVSLDEVKNNLTANFKNKVEQWINDGYCFVFVGYSCSDSLDVNVMFDELNLNSDNKSYGVIVNHSNDISFSADIDSRYNILLKFDNHYQLNINTMSFFEAIQKSDDYTEPNVEFDWVQCFRNKCTGVLSSDYKYSALGYIKMLGLDANRILGKAWYYKIRKKDYSPFKRDWYINYYVSSCLSNMGRSMISLVFASRNEKTDLQTSDMLSSINVKRAAQIGEKTDSILEYLKAFEVGKIDWNISTPLNRRTKWIIYDFLIHPFCFNKNVRRHRELAQMIIDCNDIILEKGNNFVQSYFQIITALRHNAVLYMIFNNNRDKSLKYITKAINSYDDISSLDGVLTSKMYCVFIKLVDFRINKNLQSLSEVKVDLKEIKPLLSATKNSNELFLYVLIWANYCLLKLIEHRYK